MDTTVWQFVSFFGFFAFLYVIYAVFAEQQAGRRERDENGFGLFDDLLD